MVTKEEIEKVVSWCEKIKSERKRIYVIERNPFRDEIDWMRRFALIEIDRPKEVASPNNIVYDSVTKQLWHFLNGSWRQLNPDIKIG
ncbi:hypothetical protein HY988_00275 [Candidatus Micrarchaeota archaeon]|nr:hypothetical protein [Candidatus Micrarchaeota archaeon]